jgi:hypothetical protein
LITKYNKNSKSANPNRKNQAKLFFTIIKAINKNKEVPIIDISMPLVLAIQQAYSVFLHNITKHKNSNCKGCNEYNNLYKDTQRIYTAYNILKTKNNMMPPIEIIPGDIVQYYDKQHIERLVLQ